MLGIRDVTIVTMQNGTMTKGDVLLADGRIKAYGEAVDLAGCERIIEGRGRVLTPGLIDAHTHLGLSESGVGREGTDTNESTHPLTPYLSVRDGINMQDQAFESFRRAGITTVGILPGSGNILGGTGLALKCRGDIVDDVVLKDPIGMKAALGENPKGLYGERKQSPATRMGNAALLRSALLRAKDYLNKGEDHPRDPQSEALIPVLKREIPLIIHVHRHDDITTAIRIANEFGVKCHLAHVTDGYMVTDVLKRGGVYCGVGPTMHYPSKVENKERDFRTAVVLDRENIPFCLFTDHPVVDGRNLVLTASIATQWGLSDESALAAITVWAARYLGVENRVGSIAVDMDADLVLWSGNPLELTTFVDMTIIDGEIVYQRGMQPC
ncbi:MAG: amidohydrolase [Firmicutes bacterium]|nr:amidohydrolase [Bacillota bacterium]